MTHQATLVKFAIVGMSNTLLTLALIFGAKYFWSVADIPANALGYGLGLLNGYAWNRRWTFSHRGSWLRSLPTFVLVQGAAYGVNLICAIGLIQMGFNDYAAHAAAALPYAILSYLGSRYLVFPAGRADQRG